MQINKGRDWDGDKVATAFITGGFQVGHGPKGETVLSMTVGETGKISFLLEQEMVTELAAVLMRAGTKH